MLFLVHINVHKLTLISSPADGYVTPEQMDNMCSLAIVRNPYSRMVSIYGYNRFGEGESFPKFVKRCKYAMRHYLERGEKEEWYTPCHLLPMFEYTHFNGKQLVQSIVKQEELKLLKTKEGVDEAIKQDSSVSDLPDLVRDALLGMPHTVSLLTIFDSSSFMLSSFSGQTLLCCFIYQHTNRIAEKLQRNGMTTTIRKLWT